METSLDRTRLLAFMEGMEIENPENYVEMMPEQLHQFGKVLANTVRGIAIEREVFKTGLRYSMDTASQLN